MVYFLSLPQDISRGIFFQTGYSRIKFIIELEYKKIQPKVAVCVILASWEYGNQKTGISCHLGTSIYYSVI